MLSGKGRRIAAAGFLVGACGALALALFGSPVGATPGGQSPAHQIYTDPQSASNGDFSGNGANTHGPYDSTRDGSPAMNGNGGGKGVGKPCAGCVGKADNKNPPGQMPGGSDGNAGYECDRNNGIGKSNPAHTGCTSGAESSPPPSSPGETQTPSSPGETPTPSTSPPSSGPGDTSTPSTPPSSSGAPGETPSTSPASGDSSPVESQPGDAPVGAPSSGSAPLAAAQSALAAQRASSQRLSNTGTPTAALLLIAGVCLVAGLALLGMSYRRRSVH